MQWHLRWLVLWVKNVSYLHVSWNCTIAKGAQVDGRRKPFKNKWQGAAPTLQAGVGSLLRAGRKSWLHVCSLTVGGPYWKKLEVTCVYTEPFRSQEGTLQTLLGSVSSSPLQKRPFLWHGKRVAPQLRNADDWGGLNGSIGIPCCFPCRKYMVQGSRT